MAGFKKNAPVTITVRPDGSYYVEKEKRAPRRKAAHPAPAHVVGAPPQFELLQAVPAATPYAARITAALGQFAGIATAVKAVAPKIGPYGVLAAVGVGVLSALAPQQPQPQFRLRRIRRMPK